MSWVKTTLVGPFVAFAAAAVTVTSALSMPVTIPSGLSPGDQYRLAFVTSTHRNALSSDIGDYNSFVTGVANSAGLGSLGTMWFAIGSTAAVNARDNTGTNPLTDGAGVPVYLLDAASTKIADDNADLWDGSIDTFLNVDETGAIPNPEDVWTGSSGDGTASFGGGPLGSAVSVVGRVESSDLFWISKARGGATVNHPFYALSGILTVPASIPEPAALSLMAIGLAGLAVGRRRRAGRHVSSLGHC